METTSRLSGFCSVALWCHLDYRKAWIQPLVVNIPGFAGDTYYHESLLLLPGIKNREETCIAVLATTGTCPGHSPAPFSQAE